MSTKADLEKEIKELKQIIRQLRKEVQTHVPKEDDLPENSFCVLRKGNSMNNYEFWHYELKLNSETNEIMIVDKKQYRGKMENALHKAKQHLYYQLENKDRSKYIK